MKKHLFFIIINLLLSNTSQGQWVLQGNGYSQPNITTRAIETISESIVWSCGTDWIDPAAGAFYSKTSDGGQHWIPGKIEGYLSGYLVRALSYDTAWFLAKKSDQETHLVKTTDGGLYWTVQLVIPDTNKWQNFVFFDANHGFCSGFPVVNGGYFYFLTTTDGGDTWYRVPSANIPAPVSWNEKLGVIASIGSHIWLKMRTNLQGASDRIIYSSDNGLTWSVKNFPIYVQHADWIGFQDSLHGLALGGLLLETWDNCQTWTSTSSPSFPSNGVKFVPGTWNTVVGHISTTFGYSTDGGKNWATWDTLNFVPKSVSSFASPQHGWLGSITTQFQTQDGGIWKFCGDLSGVLSLDARKGDIHVFPNPCGDELNLAMAGFEGKNGEVCLFDVHGRMIRELYQGHMTDQKLLFSLGKLPAGLYLVKAAAGDKTAIRKIMRR